MKKFLSVISLLLVAAMLMATPMYVSAEETSATEPVSYGASADYAIEKGLPVYRVPGAYVTSGDNVDGIIGINDPWYSSRSELTGIVYMSGLSDTVGVKKDAPVGACEVAVIENVKFYSYVAQDADYIYVGIESPATRTETGSVLSRHNWTIAFGFDLDDYTKYLTLSLNGDVGYSYTNGTPGYTTSEGATALSGTQVSGIVADAKTTRYATEALDKKYYVGQNKSYVGQKLNTLNDNECCETISYVEYKLSKQGLVDAGFMSAEDKADTKGMFLMIPDNCFRITNNSSLTNCGWGSGSPNARGVAELPEDIATALPNVSGKDTAFYFPTLFLFDDSVAAVDYAPVNQFTYNAGQTVHHVEKAPAVDITADGVIKDGEYGYVSELVGYKNAFIGDNNYSKLQTLIDDYTKALDGDGSVVNADPNHSGVKKLVDMIESKKAQFYFAETEDSIFFGIYDKAGYAKNENGANWELSTKYNIRFYFDANDTTKYLDWTCNNVGNNYWENASSKAPIAVVGISGVNASDALVAANMTEKFVASDVTPEGSVGQPDPDRNAEYPTESWIEIELDKSVLASWLGVEKLSNVFWFDFGGAVYLKSVNGSGGTDLENVTAGSGSWTTTLRFTGTALTESEKLYYGVSTPTIPDMIVFGHEMDVAGTCVDGANCNFVEETATDEYFRAVADCYTGESYYRYCETCGSVGVGYFETTAKLGHAPNVPEVDEQIDQVCTRCNLLLAEATGHNHTYGDGYATDGAQHWKECTACGTKGMIGAHTGAPCTVCQYGASAPVTPPAETEPAETQPAETTPVETQPAETTPAETTPAETTPAETTPAETTPAETEPAATEPAETEPAETEPAETEPAETEPADEAGCAGAISFMGLALVATLGACGVIATKKKED